MRIISNLFILLIALVTLSACNHDESNSVEAALYHDELAPRIQLTIPQQIAIYIEHDMQPHLMCKAKICPKKSLATIYQHREFLPIWLDNDGKAKPDVEQLIKVLQGSYQDGLNPERYNLKLITALLQQLNSNAAELDMLQIDAKLDIALTDAYLSYAREIQNGRVNPVVSYPDWGVSRSLIDTAQQFESSLANNQLIAELSRMTPVNPQYLRLKAKLAEYNHKSEGLASSGVSASDLITMKQIILNMDRLRWLPRNLAESYLWVNIPQFELDAINNGQVIFKMPVVVGKDGENKTCSVISSINMVEINPYWGIPRRIATQEYLVKLKANPLYLANKNIRIYNKNNKEVDPLSIDWSSVNENNFQYTFKQDPGNKNALGKVKFNFPNNCGIYLHDTSARNVFSRDARSMSHGCIRLGKPLELADYILVNRENYPAERISQLIASDEHSGLKLKQPLPLYVVYQTLLVNDDGSITRYKDIYGIDNIAVTVYQPKNDSQISQ